MKQFSRRENTNWFECGIYHAHWVANYQKKWRLYKKVGVKLIEIGRFASFELMQRGAARHEVMSIMGLEKVT
jgi:hypothetical protein